MLNNAIDMTNPLERAAYEAFGRAMDPRVKENTIQHARRVASASYLIECAIKAEKAGKGFATPTP